MGKMANNKHFQQVVVKHMLPGDELALSRFAAAMEEIREGISKGPGGFWGSLFGSTAVGTSGEIASEAANVVCNRQLFVRKYQH